MFYKPVLIEISLQQLINHVRLKADSTLGPTCTLSFADENACGVWADGNDGAGENGEGSWGYVCVEVGPLFGCNDSDDWYCSDLIPVLR